MEGGNVYFDEVKKAVESGGALVIDVRHPEEIENQGGIPNAINIPAKEVNAALCMDGCKFKKRYGVEKPEMGDKIIFTARSGRKAEKAHKVAKDLGYANAALYGGGYNDWITSGGEPAEPNCD